MDLSIGLWVGSAFKKNMYGLKAKLKSTPFFSRLFKFLLTSEGSLTQKTIRGSFWVFISRVADRGLRLGRTIILARFLSPQDFGIFGIVLLSFSILDTFSRPGIQAAVIQRKEKSDKILDVAWTIDVLRGLLVAILLFIAAPFIADFFGSKEVTLVIRVITIAVILQSLTNSAVAYFDKDLRFDKFFKFQFSGALIDFAVSVTAAIILRNVWALILGIIAGNLVRLILSYTIEKYRPKFSLSMKEVKEIIGFGKWVVGTNGLSFLTTQGDAIFVGKVLSVVSLGFYQIAYRITSAPEFLLTRMVAKVMFPVYSKLQSDPTKLSQAYLKVLHLIAFISIPLSGLIFILAQDFTHIFLGEQWNSIVPLLQIMALVGLLRSLRASGGVLFQAIGRPNTSTYIQLLNFLLIVSLIYPLGVTWGVVGVANAVLISTFITYLVFSLTIVKVLRCDILAFAKAKVVPLFATLVVGLPVIYFKEVLGVGIIQFIFYASTGIIGYLILILLFARLFNYDIVSIIKESTRSVS